MKQAVKLIVVVTVGPPGTRNTYEDFADTIHSIMHWTTTDRRIIIQDNSHPVNTGEKLRKEFPELVVMRSPRNFGLFGGLYKAESYAYQYAVENFDFQCLVRMDTDALFIGKGLEDAAIQYFHDHPNAGQLGNFLVSGEGTEWFAEQIERQTGLVAYLQDPARTVLLRQLKARALEHGWIRGQSVIGGANVLNPEMIRRIYAMGLLHREELRRAKLQEDHIFSLLCKAVGLDMVHWYMPEQPLAVVWRGMPASPQELVDNGVALIHSTRYWKDMQEEQIRAFFRMRRGGR